MRLRHCLFAIAVASLVSTLGAAEDEYARPKLLLEPSELARPEVARQFVILDVRDLEAYAQQHIPGARRVDHAEWKAAFGEGKDAEGWSERIGKLGIGPRSQVVVYDDASAKNATRIWWILRYWGVGDARLLNGGWKAWQAEGLPTTAEATDPASEAAFKAVPRTIRLLTTGQLLDSLSKNRFQVVDTRSHDEFCGIEKKGNQRAGAIPGAKHIEWTDLIDAETERFKSPDELRRLIHEAGVDLDKPTATHCQSGGRASVMAFGLELMGAQDVRNYYAGWSEWGNSEDTPIVAAEEKSGQN
jgi:thiosulfate/3-mercaptopyruvate sulfurtransferase